LPVLGFFTANRQNKNTRRAYCKTACRFADWCEGRGLLDLAHVKSPHVAAYIEMMVQPVAEGGESIVHERQLARPQHR